MVGPRRTHAQRPERQRGASAEELRRHNLSVLVDHVHLAGSASRSQLASLTGLNRSTIADLVAELFDLGLVAERRTTVATGPGRPSRVVTAQPAGAVVVAVELAVDSIAVATVGFGGHVFNRVRVDRPRGRFSPAETLDDVASLAEPLLGALPEPHRLTGVGVAVVGITRSVRRIRPLRPQSRLARRAARRPAGDAPRLRRPGVGRQRGRPRRPQRTPARRRCRRRQPAVRVRRGRDRARRDPRRRGAAGRRRVRRRGRPHARQPGRRSLPVRRRRLLGDRGRRGGAAARRRAGRRRRVRHEPVSTACWPAPPTAITAMCDACAHVGQWLGVGIGDLVNLFNPELVVLGGLFSRLYPVAEDTVTEGIRARVLDAPGCDGQGRAHRSGDRRPPARRRRAGVLRPHQPPERGRHVPSAPTNEERSMNTLHPGPEHKFAFGLWTIGHPGRDPFGEVVRPPIEPWEFVYRLGDLGGWGVSFHDDDLVPPGSTTGRARRHPRPLPQGPRLHRDGRVDGDDEPVLAPGVQGRGVHGERSRRPALRHPEGDAGDRPRRRARRPDTRLLGWSRGRRSASPPSHRSTLWRAIARRSTSCAATSAIAATRRASPSSPSRTNRAATRSCPPSATPWRSSPRSTSPRWSASTRRSPTRRWPDSASTTASPRRSTPASCSTSTSTPNRSGATTRTSASVRRGSRTPSSSSSCSRSRATTDPATSTPALPRRGLRGRVGLRPRVHAHVSRPRRQGPTLRRRPPDPGRPRRVWCHRRWPTRRSARTRRTPPQPSAPRRSTPRSWRSRATATSTSTNSSIDLILGLR